MVFPSMVWVELAVESDTAMPITDAETAPVDCLLEVDRFLTVLPCIMLVPVITAIPLVRDSEFKPVYAFVRLAIIFPVIMLVPEAELQYNPYTSCFIRDDVAAELT